MNLLWACFIAYNLWSMKVGIILPTRDILFIELLIDVNRMSLIKCHIFHHSSFWLMKVYIHNFIIIIKFSHF
jgi:hypothetical protein